MIEGYDDIITDSDDDDFNKDIKKYNVFKFTVKKNTDNTVEIKSVEQIEREGRNAQDVVKEEALPYDRVIIDEDAQVIIIVTSFDEDQVLVKGTIEVGTPTAPAKEEDSGETTTEDNSGDNSGETTEPTTEDNSGDNSGESTTPVTTDDNSGDESGEGSGNRI